MRQILFFTVMVEVQMAFLGRNGYRSLRQADINQEAGELGRRIMALYA
jgi:hypothetical protein